MQRSREKGEEVCVGEHIMMTACLPTGMGGLRGYDG